MVAAVESAPDLPGIADVQRLLDERGPIADAARVEEVGWSSHFRIHHRVAARYRAGRILLAGDAAHVHSPAGGQGMNTGIRDAVALGHALAGELGGGASGNRLDDYERARRPVAQRVVAFTDRITRLATLRGARIRTARNEMISLIGRVPLVRHRLALELAGLRDR